MHQQSEFAANIRKELNAVFTERQTVKARIKLLDKQFAQLLKLDKQYNPPPKEDRIVTQCTN